MQFFKAVTQIFVVLIVDRINSGKDHWFHLLEAVDTYREKLQEFVSQFNLNFEDIKDLSVSALIGRMLLQTDDGEARSDLQHLLKMIKGAGMGDKRVASMGLGVHKSAK